AVRRLPERQAGRSTEAGSATCNPVGRGLTRRRLDLRITLLTRDQHLRSAASCRADVEDPVHRIRHRRCVNVRATAVTRAPDRRAEAEIIVSMKRWVEEGTPVEFRQDVERLLPKLR